VLIHKGTLHDAKFGVWCATRATRVIGRYLSWNYKFTSVCYTIYNHVLITTTYAFLQLYNATIPQQTLLCTVYSVQLVTQ
jgi:hypothetical protein